MSMSGSGSTDSCGSSSASSSSNSGSSNSSSSGVAAEPGKSKKGARERQKATPNAVDPATQTVPNRVPASFDNWSLAAQVRNKG